MNTRDRRIQTAVANHITTRNTPNNVNFKIPLYTTSNANESNLAEEYINAQQSVIIGAAAEKINTTP